MIPQFHWVQNLIKIARNIEADVFIGEKNQPVFHYQRKLEFLNKGLVIVGTYFNPNKEAHTQIEIELSDLKSLKYREKHFKAGIFHELVLLAEKYVIDGISYSTPEIVLLPAFLPFYFLDFLTHNISFDPFTLSILNIDKNEVEKVKFNKQDLNSKVKFDYSSHGDGVGQLLFDKSTKQLELWTGKMIPKININDEWQSFNGNMIFNFLKK